MKYDSITPAIFISRPNRFIAHVKISEEEVTVHVKNTGRCRELLIPGSTVYLEKASNPERKTPYDLVAVEKDGRVINIDSQAPNAVVKEWLLRQKSYDLVKPEYKHGNSRIDFYMEKGQERYLMEVKGCTLEIDGMGFFPDAPTERGVKHIRELIRAKQHGYHAILAFVIQMEGVSEVHPYREMHPEFGTAMDEARHAGVKIQYCLCHVEPDELRITEVKE